MDNCPTPPRILYAEDDRVTRELFRSFFARMGWAYEVVADGDAAVRSVAQHSYDVVITDLRMPGLTGLDVLRHIRQSSPHQAVIVITGSGDVADMLGLLREGASDIIQKPVDFDTVEKSILRVVSSVRERESEKRLYRFVEDEHTRLVMTSKDLSETRLPLFIAERLYRGGKIDLNCKLRMDLAFQEALTNSLEHGNLELDSEWKDEIDSSGIDRYSLVKRQRLLDPVYAGRLIEIEIDFDGRCVSVAIKDAGRGWCGPNSAKPLSENVACHGRGLALIYASMDKVLLTDEGRRIVLVKQVEV